MKRCALAFLVYVGVLSVSAQAVAQTRPMAAPVLSQWNEQYAGTKLNLTGHSLAFEDNFNTLDVWSEQYTRLGEPGPNGTRVQQTLTGKWFAPVHPGNPKDGAKFMDPMYPSSGVSPFSVANGNLTIRAQQVNGQWQSGSMQTTDWRGDGFELNSGYFEMRAKFPAGAGSWPAFWLISQNNQTGERIEFDILEAYGWEDFDGHHTNVHARNSDGSVKAGEYTNIPGSMFDGQYHTYGGQITPEWVITYYDGVELARLPTPDIFKNASFHMITTLNMYGPMLSQASGHYDMVVDYVRAYAPSATPPSSTPSPGSTSGNDVIAGTSNSDTLNGLAGNDEIHGQAGNDTISGGDGDDRLFGEVGIDNLSGGNGSDFFMFNSIQEAHRDQIMDFVRGSDKIYLSGIDANPGASGDQAFTFLGYGTRSQTPGQVWVVDDVHEGVTHVYANTDSNWDPDFWINIRGVGLGLTASDFVL
jgi:hypothetical protein